MDVNNSLKCPEEDYDGESTSTIIVTTSVEASKLSTELAFATTTTATTVEEIQPKVIIKNPQKMMEDIFDTIDVNGEVESNRLDESSRAHKMDLDLMVGDQPMTDEMVEENKKEVFKQQQQEKKEIFPKKSAKLSKEKSSKTIKDDEQMMGDAPAPEIHSTEFEQSTTYPATTERQRRDANLIESSTVDTSSSTDTSTPTADESSSFSTELPSSLLSSSTTSEQMTTFVTEESTTKIFAHGHPLHMSQAIFKEPIQPDINNTHERIDFGDAEDRFIPPMLLVKAKFTTTTSSGEAISTMKAEHSTTDVVATSLSTEQNTIIDTTENGDESTTMKLDSNEIPLNDSSAATQLENTITSVTASEKPIMIGKRNDPRLGLNSGTTTTSTTTIIPSTTFAGN